MHEIKERKLDTFRALGTEPKEWKVAKIIDCNYDEYGQIVDPVFKKSGYQFITPFFDSIMNTNQLEEMLIEHEHNRKSGDSLIDNCQICGREIRNCWVIIHDERKIAMVIGCICVKNYPELDIEEALEKIWAEKYLQIFTDWVFKSIHHIWHTSKFQKRDPHRNLRYWSNGRRNIKKDAHTFQSDLGKIDFCNIGKKEMLSFIRRAHNRDIPIPQEFMKFVTHKISLDQYFQ